MALQALIPAMDYSSKSRNDRREKREAGGKEKETVRKKKKKQPSGFCNYKLKLRKSMTRLRSC